ncbi:MULTISPECIES: radical SAM protein [Cysteiniphilum]|uniref:Radical SAM/SPASM domain-containing protein n=1 Tax=Cysteiniphilum litorale TaxID=2056700 RepID=A0A8J3E7H8_9GAMM|nr:MULTISPECIES: radical SAM protein [Cysteiniphilum]GGF91967.1 radical SAM/SPASM domain-containing protein [Cysteiniphilum litorale]
MSKNTETFGNGYSQYNKIFYLRVHEGCNLYCQHCFIPSNPKKMNMDMIHKIVENMKFHTKEGDRVLIQWHGGEPTLKSPSWIEEAVTIINQYKKVNIEHSIQTNLMNYNHEWEQVFKKYFSGKIGVSWDHRIRLTKKNQIISHEDYESKFWTLLNQAHKDGIALDVTITLTKYFIQDWKNPIALFRRFSDCGVNSIHIEKLTKTGNARVYWDEIGVNNIEYSKYMSRLFKLYSLWNESEKMKLSISPLDDLKLGLEKFIESDVNALNKMPVCFSGACDKNFHTYDANGYKPGCTALNSEYDNSRASASLFVSNILESRSKRKANCSKCLFTEVCSSGCLASSYIDESGECSGNKILLETIYKQSQGIKEMKGVL